MSKAFIQIKNVKGTDIRLEFKHEISIEEAAKIIEFIGSIKLFEKNRK